MKKVPPGVCHSYCSALGFPSKWQAQNHPKISVGSKAFTESVVLGELISHLAREQGAEVEHRAELGGTQFLWQAMVGGRHRHLRGLHRYDSRRIAGGSGQVGRRDSQRSGHARGARDNARSDV